MSSSGQRNNEFDPYGSRAQHSNISDSAGLKRKRLVPPETFLYMRRGGGNPALVEARVRALGQEGMRGFRVFFDQNVKVKTSWFDRVRNPDLVTIG